MHAQTLLVHILQLHSSPQVMNNVIQHYCIGPLFLDAGCLLQYVVSTLSTPVIHCGTPPPWVAFFNSAWAVNVYTSTSSSESEFLWISTIWQRCDWWERLSLVDFRLDESCRCCWCMAHVQQNAVILLPSGMTRNFPVLPHSVGHSWIPSWAAGNEMRINHSCRDLGQSNTRAGQTPSQGSVMQPCPLPFPGTSELWYRFITEM